MKRDLLRVSLAFAAVLAFGVCASAQRGGGRPAGAGPGMGGPSGAGPGMGAPSDVGPGMGGPSDNRSGMGGRPTDMGSGNMGHPNIGSESPNTVLNNTRLDSSLTNALGKSGITVPGGNLQSACSRFKNLGECVAALHVAKNLNLNFNDLQSKMTGPNSESLGKAIKDLGGPGVNSKHVAKQAKKQTKRDLNSVQSATLPQSAS